MLVSYRTLDNNRGRRVERASCLWCGLGDSKTLQTHIHLASLLSRRRPASLVQTEPKTARWITAFCKLLRGAQKPKKRQACGAPPSTARRTRRPRTSSVRLERRRRRRCRGHRTKRNPSSTTCPFQQRRRKNIDRATPCRRRRSARPRPSRRCKVRPRRPRPLEITRKRRRRATAAYWEDSGARRRGARTRRSTRRRRRSRSPRRPRSSRRRPRSALRLTPARRSPRPRKTRARIWAGASRIWATMTTRASGTTSPTRRRRISRRSRITSCGTTPQRPGTRRACSRSIEDENRSSSRI